MTRNRLEAGLTILVIPLVAFWLAGMFLLRSQLWVPWLSLLSAIALSTVYLVIDR